MLIKRFGLYLETPSRDERIEFLRQVRHICSLFGRCLADISEPGATQIAVHCVSQMDRGWRAEVVNQGGILATQLRVRSSAFFKADPDKRKKIALRWLYRGALKIAKFHGWDTQLFEAARRCVIEHGYINQWTWKKSKASPNRKHSAELFCSFESDRFRAWVRVRSSSGELLKEKLAIEELPSEFCFVPKMGEFRWRSNQRVALLDKYGKKVVEVAIPKLKQ